VDDKAQNTEDRSSYQDLTRILHQADIAEQAHSVGTRSPLEAITSIIRKLEMKTFKRHLARLCLVLVGLCVALMFAEGLVRVFYPYSRDHVVPSGLFEIDDHLGWKLSAEKNATHQSRSFEATYQVNTLGYRDEPRDISKDEKIYRILLYGDSQIFGWGIPAEQRFSNLMEAQKTHLEIWNLAVPGYGLDQEVLSYEKRGELLNADEVIFFVSEAILGRTHRDYIFRKHKPKFVMGEKDGLRLVPVPQGTNEWTRLLYRILSPLYLPYFLERRLAASRRAPEQVGDAPDQNMGQGRDVIGELEKRILDRGGNIAHERKHRITIISNLPEASGEDLKSFCDQRGMDFLQITLRNEDPHLTISKHDRHWNIGAHKLIAEQLLSQLERIDPVITDTPAIGQ